MTSHQKKYLAQVEIILKNHLKTVYPDMYDVWVNWRIPTIGYKSDKIYFEQEIQKKMNEVMVKVPKYHANLKLPFKEEYNN